MSITELAASKMGHTPYVEEMKYSAGIYARNCYYPGSKEKLLKAPPETNISVAEKTLESGHHSVYDHTHVTLYLEDMPKALAMTINNEHDYATSERSGRFTKFEVTGAAAELYYKWQTKLQGVIGREMPELSPKKIEKLSLESARYFLPIFSPITTMVYTCSIRQLNYLYHWMSQFCALAPASDFERRLQSAFLDFCTELTLNHKDLLIPGLVDNKLRGLSLCAEWTRLRLLRPPLKNDFTTSTIMLVTGEETPVEWGARGYSTNYWGSFAQFAQAQRHRTLHYEITVEDPALADFYVPPVLSDELAGEWLEDMEKVRYDYPQGMLVRINESGRIEDLIQKCQERICGEAQLEICAQTLATVQEYYREAMWNGGRWSNPFVAAALRPYVHTTGCKRVKLSGHHCAEPCWWIKNGKEIEERIV